MNTFDFLQIIVFFLLLLIVSSLLGTYMYNVFTGKEKYMKKLFGKSERLILRFVKTNPEKEMNWKEYAFSLLVFNLIGMVFLFFIQIMQNALPLNPNQAENVSWHSALNTAVSFMTNTNWQGYAGETTLSYFVQMIGLTVQNFLSAATGIVVLLALIRGIARKNTVLIGNFWADLVKTTFYILLPLSIILSVASVSQGVIQNFETNTTVKTLDGGVQIIPMGPVASQLAIKQLGTNGGGFFNANSAHPLENPTPLSNFLQLLSILIVPASLTVMYGKMAKAPRHGWIIFATMAIMLFIGLSFSLHSEFSALPGYGTSQMMEGKEMRLGVTNSVLWSTTTTAASNGSVNAMHDSLTPVSGMVAMINMMIGEVIFGGAGAGLYGMILFILLTVFIAGLMVGRTPEYLGKKIESHEIKMTIIAILIPSFMILLFSAWSISTKNGLAGLGNTGPHGFSEILYAYSSAAGNNGSAFAGLNANTVFYNITIALTMLAGRFGVILPVLSIAGSLAKKNQTPQSEGTFKTDTWLFVILLITVILIVGGLTFFPALSLGPIMDQLLSSFGLIY